MKHYITRAFVIFSVIYGINCQNVIGQLTTWKTIDNGMWEDPNIWDNGTVPPSAFTINVEIYHQVSATNDLTVGTAGNLFIDDLGSLNVYQIDNNNIIDIHGALTCNNVTNHPSGIITNLGTTQITTIGNEMDGQITNYGNFKVLNQFVNQGYLNNQKHLAVGTTLRNQNYLTIATNGEVVVKELFHNDGGGSTLNLCGKLSLGLSVNDPNGDPSGIMNPAFKNDGIINGCQGGINAVFPNSQVENTNIINNIAYLCLGNTSTYTNNGDQTNDFILSCCILLTAEAGEDREICIGETITLGGEPTANNGVEPYEYYWWSPSSVVANPTVANPTVTPTATSKYFVEVTDATGCIVQDSVLISSSSVLIARAGPDHNICEGGTATLGDAVPAVCGIPVYTYSWEPAALLDDPTSPNPIAIPAVTTKFILTVTDGTAAEGKDSAFVYVDAQPAAEAGPDQTICDLSTNLEATPPPTGFGEWEVVDGTVIIEDPFNPYSGISGLQRGEIVGLKWLVSNNNCTAEDIVRIQILDLPTEANAGPDQELCNATSTFLEGNPATSGTGIWRIVAGSGAVNIVDPSNPNTELTNLPIGQEVVLEWEISVTGCSLSSLDQVVITNFQSPSEAVAGEDQTLCYDATSTTLNANTPAVGIGSWTIISGNPGISDMTSPNATVSGLAPGDEAVLAWTISNTDACPPTTDQVSIKVLPLPSVDTQSASICEGESVPVTFTGATNFIWSPDNGVSDTQSDSPVLSPQASTVYNVLVSSGGCSETTFSISIQVSPTPIVEISRDTTILAGQSAQLVARGGTRYLWSPSESLSDPNISNPVATPATTTTYTVEVANDNDCTDSGQVTVSVDDRFEVFVPQMFSPNGDGANDVLLVNTIGVAQIHFQIFDRHGKMLFETNSSDVGWDGMYKGNLQNIDTYVYVVSATTFGNKTISEKGTFQLVR